MAQINEIIELIAALLYFLVVSLLSLVQWNCKISRCLLRSHASTKSSTLSVLLTLVGVLIYFTNEQSFFSVRLLLSIVLLI